MTPKSIAVGLAVLLLLLLFAWCSEARAQASATLQWDPIPPEYAVTHYTVSYGNAPDALTLSQDSAGTTDTISNLAPGFWFFVVAATNVTATGPPSNMVAGRALPDGTFEPVPAPPAPGNPRFVILESSTDLQDWTQEIAMIDHSTQRKFYRLTTDEIDSQVQEEGDGNESAAAARADSGDRAEPELAADADPRSLQLERISLGEDPVDEAGRSEDQD